MQTTKYEYENEYEYGELLDYEHDDEHEHDRRVSSSTRTPKLMKPGLGVAHSLAKPGLVLAQGTLPFRSSSTHKLRWRSA